jgi:Ca2+-binding EF-hand superfamily protein
MTQEELLKHKAAFDEIDKDGSGFIDLSEYRASLFSSHLSKYQKIRAVIGFNFFFL